MARFHGWFLVLAVSIAVIFGSVSFLYLAGAGTLLDEVSWMVWSLWLGISSIFSFVFVWPILAWQRKQYRLELGRIHAAIYGVYHILNLDYCNKLRDALILVLYSQEDRCPCCGAVVPRHGIDDPAYHGKIMFEGKELPCPVPRARMLING